MAPLFAPGTIVLESDDVAVGVLPERGGKITNLFDKRRGREWLVQAAHELVGPADTSAPYDEGDLCGWDEMMPTISACRIPGRDIELSDHGELWRHPWNVTRHGNDALAMEMRSDLGYLFERTITLAARRLEVDYRASVTGERPFEFLWAAHPFVALGPETRLTIERASEVIEVDDLGRHRVPWPNDGLVVAKDLTYGSGRKLFVETESDRQRVVLSEPDGSALSWSWSALDGPWLGLWLENGLLSDQVLAAVEPTNGSDDSLEVSSMRGHSWTIEPGRERRWKLQVEVNGECRHNNEEAS